MALACCFEVGCQIYPARSPLFHPAECEGLGTACEACTGIIAQWINKRWCFNLWKKKKKSLPSVQASMMRCALCGTSHANASDSFWGQNMGYSHGGFLWATTSMWPVLSPWETGRSISGRDTYTAFLLGSGLVSPRKHKDGKSHLSHSRN